MLQLSPVHIFNKVVTCFACKLHGHDIRNCKTHKAKKPQRRESAGLWAEILGSQLQCPKCRDSILIPVSGKIASLDLQCIKEGCLVEVKSRCLSNRILPDYIKVHGGEYNTFVHRILNEGLTLLLIIYRVDEIRDCRVLRRVYSVSNDLLQEAVLNGRHLELQESTGSGPVMATDVSTQTQVEINRPCIMKSKKKSFIVFPNINDATIMHSYD